MFSKWISIKKLCLAKCVYLHHDTMLIDAAFDSLNQTLESFVDVCVRFALTVNKRGNLGFELTCLALPGSESHLNDNQRLAGPNISGMIISTMNLSTPILDDEFCNDLRQVLPCAPLIFSNVAMSLIEYKRIVRDVMPAIMIKFKVFQDLTYNEAVQAVQSNKVSGVTQRYKAQSGLSISSEPYFDSPGKTISKFGAKFSLQSYIPILPTYLLNFISIHLASTSWASYKTSWTSFFDFVKHRGLTVSLPVSSQILHGYVNYLKNWKLLRASTIKSYLSGLKKLHILNYRSTLAFEDPILYSYLKGIENFEACKNEICLQRNVITFPILKIWGHCIFTSDLSMFDKHVLWTGVILNL